MTVSVFAGIAFDSAGTSQDCLEKFRSLRSKQVDRVRDVHDVTLGGVRDE